MALINCPECGKEVSNSAESCPHCGFPITKQDNKRIKRIKIWELVFLISLIACLVFLCLKIFFLGIVFGISAVLSIIVVFFLNHYDK